MNYINSSYFAPIFLDYLRNIKEVENCGYWQLPFIPYTFSKYQSSPLKVFYIGSIIRKSKFPWFPERSVQFSGKRTKRSVQKKGCTQHL